MQREGDKGTRGKREGSDGAGCGKSKNHKRDYLWGLMIAFVILAGLTLIIYYLFNHHVGDSDRSLLLYALNQEYTALLADEALRDNAKDPLLKELANVLVERRKETIQLLEIRRLPPPAAI